MKLFIKNAVVFFAFPIVLISLSLPVFSACSGSPPQNMGILQPGIDFCWNNPAVCGLACPTPPDCTECERKLATCNSNLTQSNADRDKYKAELATANTQLSQCNAGWDKCKNDLSTANAENNTLNVNLSQCNANLSQCNTKLAQCVSTPCIPTTCPEKDQLVQCNTNLTQSNAEKAQCQTDKNSCNTNLTQCNAEKVQCQTDKNNCNTNLNQSNAEKTQCLTDKDKCNTDLIQSNAEKAQCLTEKTQCLTDKNLCDTNLTQRDADLEAANTLCEEEKKKLNTEYEEEKEKLNTECKEKKDRLTNTSCGTLKVSDSAQQNKHSYLANTAGNHFKLHIPAVELEGVPEFEGVYEVDMCLNNVDSLTAFAFIPESIKKITTFVNNTPKAQNIAQTGFDLVVELNQPGKVDYVVKETGVVPTPDELENKKPIEIGENNQALEKIEELKASTSYTVYLVTDLNELKTLEVTTANACENPPADTTAPNFTAGSIPKNKATQNSLQLIIKLDEPSTVYYVVLAEKADEPSIDDIKSGTDAVKSGSIEVNEANVNKTTKISGLQKSTAYVVYAVAEDKSGNPSGVQNLKGTTKD